MNEDMKEYSKYMNEIVDNLHKVIKDKEKEISQLRGRGFVLGENYPDIEKLQEENRLLNADLKQQRFNNLHNLSIDQKIADEIQSLSDTLLEVDKNLNEEKISLACIESTARMVRQTLRKLGYL